MNKRVLRLVDATLSAFMIIFGPFAYLVSKMSGSAPLSRRVLELFDIGIVGHHYYEPLFFERDLRKSLELERNIIGLELNEAYQCELISKLRYGAELRDIALEPDQGSYGYRNAMFEQGDAECYYSMIRFFKPKRIIEVGAGHSTLIARIALDKNRTENPGYVCHHVCIEPYENEWLSQIGVEVVRTPVELLPTSLTSELDSNDILFIDSSHVIRPQGDVLYLYLELLGQLNSGVLVQFHDIFTPRDYPHEWIVRERRLWNEQYLLEAFLCFNREFTVVCALNWLWHHHRSATERAFPVLATTPSFEPGSFWIRRN